MSNRPPAARSLARLAAALSLGLGLAITAPGASAQEAAIRKALSERVPNFPKIDAVSPTPVPGIFEVRFSGSEILYSDASGDHIFVNGVLLSTRNMSNLTQQSLDRALAVDFSKLPVRDAITIRQGNGERRMAVFVDPNCGFCKRFERDVATVQNVTLHIFLMPILGADSAARSRDIWCARDPARAWRAWMLENTAPPKAADGCDSQAVDRNVAFSRQHAINATPAVLFEDGTRRPGALPAKMVEDLLAAAAKKK
jgi:thiol:disulfide interchange protein DsbC